MNKVDSFAFYDHLRLKELLPDLKLRLNGSGRNVDYQLF
jgi:hypothetical protein